MNNQDRPHPSPASERAARRYAIKLKTGALRPRADGNVEGQIERFRSAAIRADLRTIQLRKVLGDLGVPVTLYATYRAFTLHVDKLIREYSHETLRQLINHALGRWTALGCDPDVLKAVCERVFELSWPAAFRP
ncbi:hypothetical protein FJY69_05980 [candidate division WOR-3 bacterium]|nr:hypothetical protein [candidate division WOR-3 bacterium]